MTGDDEALAFAWRSGDSQAGATLSARYYERVLRFFELRRSWQAEDLTQRTFLLCQQQLDRIHTSFRAYLFGIARNLLRRSLRDEVADETRRRRFGGPELGEHQTRLSVLAARRQEQVIVMRALTALEADTQTLLTLYYWEGMDARELAEVVGISASAMRSRLVKARDELRDAVHGISERDPRFSAVTIDAWMCSLVDPARAEGV